MTITNIEGYQFKSGYPLNTTSFNNVACIYVIYTNQQWLDVGETDQLGTRLSGHKRRSCWQNNASNLPIYVAVRQEGNQQTRSSVEFFLRSRLNPICGDR